MSLLNGNSVVFAVGRISSTKRDAASRSASIFGLSSPSQMSGDGVVRLAPLLGWRNVNLADLVRVVLPANIPVMILGRHCAARKFS